MLGYYSADFFAVVFFAVDFFAVDFFAAVFLAVVFLAVVFLAAEVFDPAAARPRDVVFFSLLGHSMLTQMRHGPRAVSTTTMGAPHSGQVSPVACSLPRAGSG